MLRANESLLNDRCYRSTNRYHNNFHGGELTYIIDGADICTIRQCTRTNVELSK